jgi:hypothetical protein
MQFVRVDNDALLSAGQSNKKIGEFVIEVALWTLCKDKQIAAHVLEILAHVTFQANTCEVVEYSCEVK